MLYEIGSRPTTARRRLAAVKSFCVWLHKEGALDARLLWSIRGPRLRNELPDVPSESDMKRLIEGTIPGPLPERDRAMLELLYGSGLRASEVIGINLSDFKEPDVVLIRGKGSKERFAVFGECARRAIDAWLPIRQKLVNEFSLTTDALFFKAKQERVAITQSVLRSKASQGKLAKKLGVNQSWISVLRKRESQGHERRQKVPVRLDVRSVGRIVKRIAEANGLPSFNPHALRHACATHMHDHGAPLQMVAIQLGHENLETATVYTRVSTGRMQDVYRKAHPHARKIA
jgi:integrase/recombinase XerC